MNIIEINSCQDYVAPDLAVAKEFMSPRVSGLKNLSIAEITIPPGATVRPHYHNESEEVYHVVKGSGQMHLDGETNPITLGESVAIKQRQWHSITNETDTPLVMIVTCAPPWNEEDQVFEAPTESE